MAVAKENGPKLVPERIDPRALAAEPEQHVGKAVVLTGQVVRVLERDEQRWVELLALPAGETTVQAVDLLLDTSVGVIELEECYQVMGVAAGRDEVSSAFGGGRRDVPLVLATETAPAPVGPYGIGCAAP